MHRIMLGLFVWVLAGFVAVFVLGMTGGFKSAHYLAGLFIPILMVMIQTMVMFHFIGSGKEIKEGLQEFEDTEGIREELITSKNKVFPIATWTILITMAVPILGGGTASNRLAPWIHAGLGILALVLNIRAIQVEYQYLKLNLSLIHTVDKILVALAQKAEEQESKTPQSPPAESTLDKIPHPNQERS